MDLGEAGLATVLSSGLLSDDYRTITAWLRPSRAAVRVSGFRPQVLCRAGKVRPTAHSGAIRPEEQRRAVLGSPESEVSMTIRKFS